MYVFTVIYENCMETKFSGFPHSRKMQQNPLHRENLGNWYSYFSHGVGAFFPLDVPILWEKYEYQLPRFSPCNGFCCIFPCYGKLMRKPMHFPYGEAYRRMGIGKKKSAHTMGKV